MVTIEVLRAEDITKDEPTIVEKIQISEIEPLRITPADIQNGIPISMSELPNLISEIRPLKKLLQEELDSYFAQQIPVYYDGNLSTQKLDLPHHIGLRVVLENLLQKHGSCKTLIIKIS